MTERQTRRWQRDCLTAIEMTAAEGKTDFLAAVTPSGGKTILGLEYAQRALETGHVDVVAVLVPSLTIQSYWISEAALLGMTFATTMGATAVGVVFTYQMLGKGGANALKKLCKAKRVLVIADEIHHGGMGKLWGDAVHRATEHAAFRLGLSGTPFRTDDAAIPILRYSGNVGVPHFEHSYGDALEEDVVAPVFFRWSNGSVTLSDDEVLSFDDSGSLGDDDAGRLLTAATAAGTGFSRESLAGAHSELMNCRAMDGTAAGLIIAQDIKAATTAHEYLTQTLKADAVLVVSSEPDAHATLEAFKTNDVEWLVSVAMVNEGVDIPRLKVLALLANDRTELSFVQAVGRLTRIMPERDDQRVLVHLPKLATFETYAARIEIARNHVLKGKSRSHSPGAPSRRFCSQCGEPSGVTAPACKSCGHAFPTRSTTSGAVILNSDGFQDGLTLAGTSPRPTSTPSSLCSAAATRTSRTCARKAAPSGAASNWRSWRCWRRAKA